MAKKRMVVQFGHGTAISMNSPVRAKQHRRIAGEHVARTTGAA